MARLVIAGCSATVAMGAVNRHATVHATVNHNLHAIARDAQDAVDTADLEMSAEVKATMDTFVSAWLSDKENPPSVSELVRTVGNKMDFKAAAAKMEKKKTSRRCCRSHQNSRNRRNPSASAFQ
jgi:hypothetical protein